MDPFRFDALSRALGASVNRRAVLRTALAAVAVPPGLAAVGDGAARKRKKKRCKPRCARCEQCEQRACQPKQDGTRCGKHKHCERNACVACTPTGGACAFVDAAACCSQACCAAGVAHCPPGVDPCCCKQ